MHRSFELCICKSEPASLGSSLPNFREPPTRELQRILLLRTRMNKGEAASHRRQLPPPNPRSFGATGTPYTLGGGYDTQAASLLPRTPPTERSGSTLSAIATTDAALSTPLP